MPTVYFITGSQNTVATSLMKGLLQLRFPEMTLLLQTASEREAVYEMKARCEQSDVVMLVGTPDPIDHSVLAIAELHELPNCSARACLRTRHTGHSGRQWTQLSRKTTTSPQRPSGSLRRGCNERLPSGSLFSNKRRN